MYSWLNTVELILMGPSPGSSSTVSVSEYGSWDVIRRAWVSGGVRDRQAIILLHTVGGIIGAPGNGVLLLRSNESQEMVADSFLMAA